MIDPAEFAAWRAGFVAHSTHVGLTQGLFVSDKDRAGIMHALRWKIAGSTARDSQALAAGSNAAARVVGKL